VKETAASKASCRHAADDRRGVSGWATHPFTMKL
jgi:hypothetical protein